MEYKEEEIDVDANNDGSVAIADFTTNWNSSDDPANFDNDDPTKGEIEAHKEKLRKNPNKNPHVEPKNAFGDMFKMDVY